MRGRDGRIACGETCEHARSRSPDAFPIPWMSPASHGSVAALTSGHPRLEPEDESVAGRDGMERLGGTSRRIRFTGFSAGF